VDIPADAKLRLAHSTHLTPEEEARWGQHFADYEVIAFLPQLGRKRLHLEASKASETRIAASHTIHALKLRGHATRLGFDLCVGHQAKCGGSRQSILTRQNCSKYSSSGHETEAASGPQAKAEE
jgi:hypothetical protein